MTRIILIAFLSFMLFEPPYSCIYLGNRIPKEAYPETISEFKRQVVIDGGKNILTEYVNANRPRQCSIGVRIYSTDSPADAEDYLNLSSAKCSAENIKLSNYDSSLLKNEDLQDNTGEKAGIIRICQDFEQEKENYYVEMTNGDIAFFIRTNNFYAEKDNSEMLELKQVVEFVKSIPFNSNLDFKTENLQKEKTK